jgi:hypothetical protein
MSIDRDLELVRELHPASAESSEAHNRARAALVTQITNTPVLPAGRRRVRREFSLRASHGLAAALVVIVMAVVVDLGSRGGAGQPASAAAAVLERAAVAAQAAGGPGELRPGEYWYVHSRNIVNGADFVSNPHRSYLIVDALTRYDRQEWIGVDRRGFVKQRFVSVQFLSPAARQQWIRDGRPTPYRSPLEGSVPPLAYQQLLALPTNVNALYNVIERDAGKGGALWRQGARWQRHAMFTAVSNLLRDNPLPAGVRAALYRVAARIPGIELLALTHDPIGRPALAITLNDTFNGERGELLFDPRTANLLAETSVTVTPGHKYHVKPGTVRTGIIYLTSGTVKHIGQLPPPRHDSLVP